MALPSCHSKLLADLKHKAFSSESLKEKQEFLKFPLPPFRIPLSLFNPAIYLPWEALADWAYTASKSVFLTAYPLSSI